MAMSDNETKKDKPPKKPFEPKPIDPKYRIRLQRYLHTASELPKYYPGCWDSKHFKSEPIECIKEALEIDKECVDVVHIIVASYKDDWTRFQPFAYALSKCLGEGGPHVREQAYKAVTEMCQTPEQLMTFVKYSRMYKTGNGQGWCRAIKRWYNSKDPMELAKQVCRVKGRHGHSHNTLIRKSHIKVDETDIPRATVVKYVLLGLKKTKQLVGDKAEAKEILDYFEKIESLRHCEDAEAAAKIVTDNGYTIDHVPTHLLTTQEVWDAVLPHLSLEEILNNIQRIHNMGFLAADSTTTTILLSILTNKEFIKKSPVPPISVYITMCNYKKLSKPLKIEKKRNAVEKQQRRRNKQIFDASTGQWEWTVTRRHPREVKIWGIDKPPNQAVLTALNVLLDETWALTPATGARYMITVDMRHHMFKGHLFCKNYVVPKKNRKVSPAKAATSTATTTTTVGAGGDTSEAVEKKSQRRLFAECFYNTHVTPGHAAIVTALHLLKREKNVTLAVFSDENITTLDVEPNYSSFDEVEHIFRNAAVGKVQMDTPISYAMKKDKKVDVFINIIDRPSRLMELDHEQRGGRGPGGRYGEPPSDEMTLDRCPVRALIKYRAQAKMPDAKLIVMSLASHLSGTSTYEDEGVLDIVGIDEHTPKVMDAFVRGQFK